MLWWEKCAALWEIGIRLNPPLRVTKSTGIISKRKITGNIHFFEGAVIRIKNTLMKKMYDAAVSNKNKARRPKNFQADME
jgi:hypothetical protein